MDSNFKRQIIIDNYQNAKNRGIPEDTSEYIKINSNNVSCIDNIDIYVKIKNDIIQDIMYDGEACVIAISSTSILSEMLKGKKIQEADDIIRNYFNMIDEKEYNKELLGEANVYEDIYKQPSRKTCSTLFANGILRVIK